MTKHSQKNFEHILKRIKYNDIYLTQINFNKDHRIHSFELRDDDIIKLADGLKNNQNVTTLQLSGNLIRSKGAMKLANSLVNTNITHLDLSNNYLRVNGTKAIADLISQNKKLTSINIAYNFIGNDGAIYLAKALALKDTVVVALNLCNNKITDKGSTALASTLENYNHTLRELNLYDNSISTNGIAAWDQALRNNRTLISLYIRTNNDSENLNQRIHNKLLLNEHCRQKSMAKIRPVNQSVYESKHLHEFYKIFKEDNKKQSKNVAKNNYQEFRLDIENSISQDLDQPTTNCGKNKSNKDRKTDITNMIVSLVKRNNTGLKNLEKFLLKDMQSQREMDLIVSNQTLKMYFDQLASFLNHIFLAAKVISSDLILVDPDNYKYNIFSSILKKTLSATKILPVVGNISDGVVKLIDLKKIRKTKIEMRHISDALTYDANNILSESLLAQEMARKVTLAKKNQLLGLSQPINTSSAPSGWIDKIWERLKKFKENTEEKISNHILYPLIEFIKGQPLKPIQRQANEDGLVIVTDMMKNDKYQKCKKETIISHSLKTIMNDKKFVFHSPYENSSNTGSSSYHHQQSIFIKPHTKDNEDKKTSMLANSKTKYKQNEIDQIKQRLNRLENINRDNHTINTGNQQQRHEIIPNYNQNSSAQHGLFSIQQQLDDHHTELLQIKAITQQNQSDYKELQDLNRPTIKESQCVLL